MEVTTNDKGESVDHIDENGHGHRTFDCVGAPAALETAKTLTQVVNWQHVLSSRPPGYAKPNPHGTFRFASKPENPFRYVIAAQDRRDRFVSEHKGEMEDSLRQAIIGIVNTSDNGTISFHRGDYGTGEKARKARADWKYILARTGFNVWESTVEHAGIDENGIPFDHYRLHYGR